MTQLTEGIGIHRIPLLGRSECGDVAARLDEVNPSWVKRGSAFYTLGAATYLDLCGSGGSFERYAGLAAQGNPILDSEFGHVLNAVRATVSGIVGAECQFAADLARPGFHIFLAESLVLAMRDILHLDLQYRALQLPADMYSPTATFTLPIEIPFSGAGIELCRASRANKKGEITLEPYHVGELFVHSGRTLHRRAHMLAAASCRRITLQGHALQVEGGEWVLYW